jgi:hypothetical protein
MLVLAIACSDDASDDTADSGAVTSEGSPTSTAGEATAADSTGPGEPVECGDLTCGEGQLCVVPSCCNGPEPSCFELPASGDCGDGTLDMTGSNCCLNDPDPRTCMETQWCISGPCTPDPPSCVAAELVTCEEVGTCSLEDGCNGQLEDGSLVCEPCG